MDIRSVKTEDDHVGLRWASNISSALAFVIGDYVQWDREALANAAGT